MPEDKGTYAERFGAPFQQHILSAVARTPGFILRYRSALSHTYFSAELHRVVARALLAHVDEYTTLPTRVTLVQSAQELVDDTVSAKIDQVVGKLYAEDISDVRAVMAKAVEFGKQQAMINAVLDAGEEIDKGNRDVLAIIREAELVGEDVLDVGLDYKERVQVRADYYTTPAEERLEADVIPTGIAHLDYALDGGLARGELGVILAPPKRGKTTSLINLGFGALTCVAGYKVAHYTFEIADKKVERRYDDRLVKSAVQWKKTDPKRFAKVVKDRVSKYIFGELIVKGYPTRTAGPSTLRNHLSILASQDWFADLIIVDYADIMKAERRLGEMRHEQAGVYEDLRQIAGEYNAAVWTASQAPQRVLSKVTLDLGDFAETFEKAAIIDVAVAFCQTPDERLMQQCRFALIGTRSVEDGRMVECDINRRECRIESRRLLDAGGVPVPTTVGGGSEGASVKTTVKLRQATAKAKVGLKKKSKKVKLKGKGKAPGKRWE